MRCQYMAQASQASKRHNCCTLSFCTMSKVDKLKDPLEPATKQRFLLRHRHAYVSPEIQPAQAQQVSDITRVQHKRYRSCN